METKPPHRFRPLSLDRLDRKPFADDRNGGERGDPRKEPVVLDKRALRPKERLAAAAIGFAVALAILALAIISLSLATNRPRPSSPGLSDIERAELITLATDLRKYYR